MFRKKTRIDGFTLIELLVVVAIIALLISILLPSLQKARATAQRIVCGTGAAQVSKAMGMYADENKNFFVPISHKKGVWDEQKGWHKNQKMMKILGLYVPKEGDSFVTGNASGNNKGNEGWGGLRCPQVPDIDEPNVFFKGHSYSMNNNFKGHAVKDNYFNRSGIGNPTRLIQFIDGNATTASHARANAIKKWDIHGEYKSKEKGKNAVTYRHAETANASYFDGHVGNLTKTQAYAKNRSPETWQMWKGLPEKP